ncbi:MAG: aspartate--tRNA(Asn) ligase [Nitrososphaerales archaeon]
MVDIRRTHYANQLNESLVGSNVRIAGWVEDLRDLGSLLFLTVRDASGTTQIVVSDQQKLNSAKNITRQSVVAISGSVQKSKAKAFPVEVKAGEVTVLTNAVHPLPVDPTGRVGASIDLRLDSRALDLRNPRVLSLFRIRHEASQSIRKTLVANQFIEVNTPKIIGSASEGGANLFSLEYFGKKAYLAQSPQLYKEQLTMALDRVFEIAPYYRAEKSHTVRHLNEFISVDIEAAFMDAEDVMKVAEHVVRNVLADVEEKSVDDLKQLDSKITVPSLPFEKLRYLQVLDELKKEGIDLEFGEDLPDQALRVLGEKRKGYYWIVDWPLKLKPFYIHEKESSPELSCSFDLQYGYLELASGGRRQHDVKKLKARLQEQGLDPRDFEDHVKVFEWGMPPHSGWGLGFDRLMMVLCNTNNIREVVLYPRDTERLKP